MKRSTIWDNKVICGVFAAVFWLTIWQVVSLCTPTLLFASPLRTIFALLGQIGQGDFWSSILHTLGKTALGFVLAFVFGIALAVLCHHYALPRILLEPAVQGMKSVPVACFIVVSLIWLTSAWLSVLVSFFVAFPVTYLNMASGLSRRDVQLCEMAQIFRVPRIKRLRYVDLPQLLPDILAGCRISVGMCWKASIAGELIGLPRYSIGEQLYMSKLYLATDVLFAWIIVIVCISVFTEKLVARALRLVQQRMEGH